MKVKGKDQPVQVASTDMVISAGQLKTRDGNSSVATTTKFESEPLSSCMPDSFWEELRWMKIVSPTGAKLNLQVWDRDGDPVCIRAAEVLPPGLLRIFVGGGAHCGGGDWVHYLLTHT